MWDEGSGLGEKAAAQTVGDSISRRKTYPHCSRANREQLKQVEIHCSCGTQGEGTCFLTYWVLSRRSGFKIWGAGIGVSGLNFWVSILRFKVSNVYD